MAAPRRVGKENSETRTAVLDAVESLLLASGPAGVTYRAVAAAAGVTPSLVQYYFPSLDDLLVSTVRRRSEQSWRRLVSMLAARPSAPLRVLWEFSKDETHAALTIEFASLGNHRESVRREIADHTNRVRAVQLDAIRETSSADLPAEAVLFLLSGIPKLQQMEEDFGVDVGHAEVDALVETFLDESEPDR